MLAVLGRHQLTAILALIDFGPQAPLPLRIHCCIGDSAISHTILLINRPWFQRSISDPEQTNKIPSDICVQAAVTCITALQRVTELLNGPTNRFW